MIRKIHASGVIAICLLVVVVALVSSAPLTVEQRLESLELRLTKVENVTKNIKPNTAGGSAGGSWSFPDGKVIDMPKDSDMGTLSSSGTFHYWDMCPYYAPVMSYKDAKEQNPTLKPCSLCMKHMLPPGAKAEVPKDLDKNDKK